jgi:hypothetical protein
MGIVNIAAGIVLAFAALCLHGLLAAAGTPAVGVLLVVGGLAWVLALALLLKQLRHELKTSRRSRPEAGDR